PTMRTLARHLGSVAVLAIFACQGSAQVIGFENVAPAGGIVNVSPTTPYNEAGFRLTPLNSSSAVFDSAAASTMNGNPSDWFGFAEGNTITLSSFPFQPFNLNSLLAGPSSIATAPPITMNLVGNLAGGGTLNASFPALTTATLETLNWTNLSSVTISTTD